MSQDYTDLLTLKNALAATGTTYLDADIANAISAASVAIDEACGRHFYSSTETRYYTPGRSVGATLYSRTDNTLDIDDLVSLTSLKVDNSGDGTYDTTWTNGTEFYLGPINANTDGYPYEQVVLRQQNGASFPYWDNSIQIIGTFGWPAIPANVTQYCIIYATQLLLRTRQAPFGVLMAGVEIGALTRISRFDPDFDRLLGRYVKPNRLLA